MIREVTAVGRFEYEQALRFAASEMERLTRERDEQARLRQAYQDAEGLALLSREAWKARAEAAEADNATLKDEFIGALTKMHNALVAFEAPNSQPFDDAVGATLERLLAAEKVVEAARELSAYEDFTVDLEPGCDTTPDDPRGLNAARRSVHGALAAYDALKEGGGMTVHHLKTRPEHFQAVRSGAKPFEVRKDDRGFQVGDTLVLNEYLPDVLDYTSEHEVRMVTYVLRGTEHVAPGYCILGFSSVARLVVSEPCWQGTVSLVPEES